MFRRERVRQEKKSDQQQARKRKDRQDSPGQDGRSLAKPAKLIDDPRLVHPANIARLVEPLLACQQALGNAWLRKVLAKQDKLVQPQSPRTAGLPHPLGGTGRTSIPIQAKLTISHPGDPYEQEAEQVAGQVMAGTQAQRQPAEEEEEAYPVQKAAAPGADLRRQTEAGEEEEEEIVQEARWDTTLLPARQGRPPDGQRWMIARQVQFGPGPQPRTSDESPWPQPPFLSVPAPIQRQAEEEEEAIQEKPAAGWGPQILPSLESRIRSVRGGGQPLRASVRAFFEQRLGYDFRQVHVHTGPDAAETAQALRARAFTTGSDVVFASGQYAPETAAGKHLLAHELTHVVQQGGANWMVQRQAEEQESPLPIPQLPPVSGEGKFTYTYKGKKALAGANARWEATPTVKAATVKGGKLWYGRLRTFWMKGKYWINTTTKWNKIADFPGGAYDAAFNTPTGSRTHELAELRAAGNLWRAAQRKIRAGTKKGFNTKALATTNFNTVFGAQIAIFQTKTGAISDHSNPIGPDAEWAYYKRRFAAHKKSLKKKKKGTP